MSKTTVWHGCYEDSWRDLIVEEAFAHPAKFARGLIRRIYRHCLERGYLRPGDTAVDPFGGQVVKRKERKSFFRRLAEKKGSPRIDHEVVLILRKSLDALP